MNQGVSQLDQVTQSNAAQTEELSSTAQALSQQAEELQALVAKFRTGAASQPSQARRKPPIKLEPKLTRKAASEASSTRGSRVLLAHELNDPPTAIVSYAALLPARLVPPR